MCGSIYECLENCELMVTEEKLGLFLTPKSITKKDSLCSKVNYSTTFFDDETVYKSSVIKSDSRSATTSGQLCQTLSHL